MKRFAAALLSLPILAMALSYSQHSSPLIRSGRICGWRTEYTIFADPGITTVIVTIGTNANTAWSSGCDISNGKCSVTFDINPANITNGPIITQFPAPIR